jgi:hypothetical protein
MTRAIVLVALASLLAGEAYACPPGQETGRQLEKEGCAVVKPRPGKARSSTHGDISPADKENLERAMNRNVLQSVDDQLRRQRFGN